MFSDFLYELGKDLSYGQRKSLIFLCANSKKNAEKIFKYHLVFWNHHQKVSIIYFFQSSVCVRRRFVYYVASRLHFYPQYCLQQIKKRDKDPYRKDVDILLCMVTVCMPTFIHESLTVNPVAKSDSRALLYFLLGVHS